MLDWNLDGASMASSEFGERTFTKLTRLAWLLIRTVMIA